MALRESAVHLRAVWKMKTWNLFQTINPEAQQSNKIKATLQQLEPVTWRVLHLSNISHQAIQLYKMTAVLLATSCLLPIEIPKEILLKLAKYKCMLNESRQQLKVQNKNLKKGTKNPRQCNLREWNIIKSHCVDSPQSTSGHRQITLYSSSKSNILNSTGWLTNSEVEAA